VKIYAVNGSPTTENGMPHVLLENFLDGALDAGAEVESHLLQKEKIGYCNGCMNCWIKTPGRCVQRGDNERTEDSSGQDGAPPRTCFLTSPLCKGKNCL